MIRQYELVEKVRGYDMATNEDLLNRAYVFSMKAHGSQIRESGDPYFSHPLEVAGILTDLKLDWTTIATALLHDTVEDTLATVEEIEGKFGDEIARLVDGVTKLSQLEMASGNRNQQAENFRKLVLAMSNDIRVLLVKLADRLHNMRTLSFVRNPDKRRRIASETMEIYAPLAERIGMQNIKDELEDLSFAVLNPEARESIDSRLEFLRHQGGDLVGRVTDELRRTLAADMIKAQVLGREKRVFSIWRKMERKNVSFEQLSDIMAFRIQVETMEDCYRVLGVVHGRYSMVPGSFKDYISTPKRNGYQSLHTAVIGPEQQRIEIQIRTRDMHEVAELGVAAHWIYKQSGEMADGSQYRWLRELLEILDNASNPEEFLEHTKLEMFQDQVFCFTPKGTLIALPRGATPVDFAYAVHTEVGDTCAGARINGRMAPLRTRLANGDQVEIVRSNVRAPSPTWEKFAITGKARSAVRRFIRKQQRSQYLDLGQAMLKKAFRERGEQYGEKKLAAVAEALKLRGSDDICAAVGRGELPASRVISAVFPDQTVKARAGKLLSRIRPRGKPRRGGDAAVPIRGLIPGMAVHFAGCCHALPGDRIVGIITTGKGVTIHTIDCETLAQFNDTPERWLDVSWNVDDETPDVHVARIETVLMNEPGSLSTLASVIANNHGNISNLKIVDRSTDFFEMLVDIEVQDVKHLTNIIAALRASAAISSVERARG
ncbi:MAG TPA: bifunctional (p)ppGpp synthetase/guanosine-3',5'-bis(diphosphate) 3'-pyrophosphohydrolase [Alphaproteobacteria bacterium]|nr:bifunctional (p)ppGpp synthetase/guanosine-3',5'-bis(diphosphate) 3'-pyrophosphohydrolase [Alphaproteobacteria bacterium]